MQLRVPFATLIKIALAVLLVVCVIKLWPVILMLAFALLLAVMLDPLVGWLTRHGMRRKGGVAIVAAGLIALLVVLFAALVPMISREATAMAKQWPQLEQRILASFPAAGPIFGSVRGGAEMRTWLTRGFVAGVWVLRGVTALVFVIVVAIYLLLEGRVAFEWLVSFAPPRQRDRLVRTAEESRPVVLAYVRGNVITSVCCAVYVLIALLILRVPGVALLTLIAFVFDFVPVVGSIVQIVPAAALALTISPTRALLVIAAYALYHFIENYLIAPRVYGKQLRLSKLAVLLAFTVGAMLQGVAGAVLALPIAAAWPIVERIWLREKLPADTIAIHERLEENED